jgi:hypothetical protein
MPIQIQSKQPDRRSKRLFLGLITFLAIQFTAIYINAQTTKETPVSQPVLEPKTQSYVDAVSSQGGKPLYTLLQGCP